MSFTIDNPVNYFPQVSKFGAVGGGSLYIGVVDGDPANVPADRIQVYKARQNDTDLAISQPISLSPGGVPMHNGSAITIKNTGVAFSMQVLDSQGQQIFYSPKSGEIAAAILSLQSQISGLIPTVETFADLATTPATTAGMIVYVKQHTSGGVGGGYFQDTAGTITNNGGTLINNTVTAGRHWRRINYSHLTVDMFGADPSGIADSTASFNLAIDYANSIGGDDASNITGVTICIGVGRFKIDGSLNPITKSGVNFVGSAENGSVLLLKNGLTAFTWGDGGTTTVVGGGLANCKLEYLTAPSATTIIFNINGAFRLNFSNLILVNIGTLASLGVSSSAIAGGIAFNRVRGFVNNGGRTLFDLRYGAGLFLDDVQVFVGGVGNPKNTSFTASFASSVMTVPVAPAAPLAVGDIIHGVGIADGTIISSFGTGTGGIGTYNLSTSPGTLSARAVNATADMTTTAGTYAIRCDVGFWDTVQATNVLLERFDIAFAVTAGSGMVYQNFFFSNFVADYTKRYVCYFESQSGGVVSGIRFSKDCWFSCWSSDAFVFIGTGYHDNHDINGMITIAGLRGVYYALANARNNMFQLFINSVNRLGTAAATFEVAANSTGFHVTSSAGNVDTTNLGLPWRASYGIQILSDCDYFSVLCCDFDGAISGYNVDPANTSGSTNRIIAKNLRANYAVNQVIAVPATTVSYTNKTAMVQEWHLFGGTITGTGYVKKGTTVGILPYFCTRLHPGETFSVGYSVAPTAKTFVEP